MSAPERTLEQRVKSLETFHIFICIVIILGNVLDFIGSH